MKRELLLLKSSKQRARENSKELQFLRKRRAKSLNDGAQEAKSVYVDKESLQREVKRLGSIKTELENTVQKLKKEITTLEDEKVCLLGSLYHQLERNESLEMQIEELTAALHVWEAKSELENDVFSENQEKHEENNNMPLVDNKIVLDDTKILDVVHLPVSLDDVNERPKSPVMAAAEESMHEMKEKIHALSDKLKSVQESVIDVETERNKLLEELEESKKNEKELRNVIVQLKRENSIYEDKLTKNNETAETLQIRLNQIKTVKEETEESLVEAKAEREIAKKHCEVLDNRLKEVTSQRDQYKDKTDHLNECLKELYGCISEMVQTDEIEQDESLMNQEELQTGIYNGLAAFQNSITDVMKQLNEKNDKLATLNGQLDASNLEKEALLKSLRESEAKKKQLKGFISKVTEEKENITEQLDEMKQQKSNLADALENVYQSKEKLQNRLSEALCKQEQHKKTLTESIDEGKALRESLYRMVSEHETMKESLLNANREVEHLKNRKEIVKTKELTEENENKVQEPSFEYENGNTVTNFIDDVQELIKNLLTSLKVLQNEIIEKSNIEGTYPSEEDNVKSSSLFIDDSLFLLKKKIRELNECIQNVSPELQRLKKIQDEDDAISGLVEFQANMLTDKLDCTEEHLKLLTIEKESIEKELENATSENIRLLEDLAALRKENEEIRNVHKTPEHKPLIHQEETLQESERNDVFQNDPKIISTEPNDLLQTSEKLNVEQLKGLVKELQQKNNNLDCKVTELAEKHVNFNAIEEELEKSNNETKALEKQVEVLSKEGAILRGEADERVQRLIELEENMILTIEKKLELAEYASMLSSKKDVLEKKCQELSDEVQSLKQSRDQILTIKSQSDEKMKLELDSLREFKEKAAKDIDDLNDILRVGKQDFEAMKIELDSMQRKNRSLKQELEKLTSKEDPKEQLPTIEIQLMKLKILKLEDEAINSNEKLVEVEKQRDQGMHFLKQLISVYETVYNENLNDENTFANCDLKTKVSQLEKWIKESSLCMKTNTNKIQLLESFIQEFEDKASEALSRDKQTDSSNETIENENNYNKLQRLVQMHKDGRQLQENYKAQLKELKDDNEKLTKLLQEKSVTLTEMTESFKQLIQEKYVLEEKHQQIGDSNKHASGPNHCKNCENLMIELDELKSVITNMNDDSLQLKNTCRQLKEQLVQLIHQERDLNPEDDKSNPSNTHDSELNNANITITQVKMEDKAFQHQNQTSEPIENMEELFGSTNLEPDGIQKCFDEESKVIEEVGSEIVTFSIADKSIDGSPKLEKDIQHQLNDLILQIKNYQKEAKALKDTNKCLEEKIVCLNQDMNKIKDEHQKETNNIKIEFLNQEQELDVLNKEKEERMKLIANLKTKIDDLKSISYRMKEPPKSGELNDENDKESIQLHKMLAERSSSLKDLNEKLGVSKNFMHKILDENRDLKKKVSDYEIQQKESKKQLEVLRADIDLKKTVLGELKDNKSQLEITKSRLDEDLIRVKEQLKTRGTLLTTLEKDKESFKRSLYEVQQENASLKKQYDLLQELAESGKQRQKDTEELVKKLKESCDEMTENFERVSKEKKMIQDSLNEELKTERRKSDSFEEKVFILDKSQSSSEKVLAEHKEKIQTLTRELRRDKSRKEREIASIMQENERLLTDETRLQKELENIRDQLEYERTKNEKLEQDLKSAIIHNVTLNNSLKTQSEENDKTSKDLEGNKKESRRLNTLTCDLKSRISNLEDLLKITKDEKKFLAEEAENAKMVNADLRLRLKESNEDKEELEDILVEMREKRQKLHCEVDKALTERDELEDTLFDLKKESSKKLEMASEQQKTTDEALQKSIKNEIVLKDEIQLLKMEQKKIVDENNSLKDDLEKTKIDLIQLLQSSSKNEESNDPSKESQLLNKNLEEFTLEKRHNEAIENPQVEEIIEKVHVEPVQQTGVQQSFFNKILDPKEEICQDENTKLQNEVKQSQHKISLFKQQLHTFSKKQVQDDMKYESLKLKYTSLEDELRKTTSRLSRARTSLKASNASILVLRRHLQEAQAKIENDCGKAKQGIVEKVTITSMEVPRTSQIKGLDFPVAKAESLESARKEILILEAKFQDLHEKAKNDQKILEKLLSEINNELIRVRGLFAVEPEEHATKSRQISSIAVNVTYDILQDNIFDLRKDIDTLERQLPNNKNFISASVSREDVSVFNKLGTVIKENHQLRDKLQFLEDRLTAILEEKQVLEDIGSSTRKELRSLVKSLSSEREEKKSINTEYWHLKSLLVDAEKKIAELTTMKSLENDEPVSEVIVVNDAMNTMESHTNVESKHLEMELMEQDKELQLVRKENQELKISRDELLNRYQKLESEKYSLENTIKKLELQIQDMGSESKRKERYLVSYREDNERLLTIQKTSEAQIRHLNREIELFNDRLVCCETEKEQILETNLQQQNEMQELFLQNAKDNVVREKLEKLFYENTKVKEQKKMMSVRLQSLEKDMKSQILTTRDLEAEREESLNKIDKLISEKQNEISKKERLAYSLEKQERESNEKIDSLTRLVEKLKQDMDELCSKNPRLDKIHQENKNLSKECSYKETVITKLHEQNHALKKEMDKLRKSYDKLKESQRMLSPNYDVKESLLKAEPFSRISPRLSHKSSLSSIERPSPASSRGSSLGKHDYRNRSTPIRGSPSRRREDLSGGSSQDCFCSPFLSAVSMRSYEDELTEYQSNHTDGTINWKPTLKEHYV